MPISDRVTRLGSGIFARNARRKSDYTERRQRTLAADQAPPPPLLDLSLGSTDVAPPAAVIAAIGGALQTPVSASYCLHGATLPFREAAAAWVHRRFDVTVDPEREVLLLILSLIHI